MSQSLRPSSIVLLTRGGIESVYLVERARELRFFGGFHACPGGNIDPRDREVAGEDEELAYALCAARELFEETGVSPPGLLDGLTAEARADLRTALLEDSAAAGAYWERAAGSLEALGALRPFGLLITPPFAPVRYRTQMFHLELPAGVEPSILPGELTDGRFVGPAEELRRWDRGEVRIVPPVLAMLEALADAPLTQALAHASDVCDEMLAGVLHPSRCSPGVRMIPLRTPTIPPATTTNTYLIGERKLFILDPATPYADEQARLFELLDRLLAEGRELAGILATHHHHDHIGAVVETSKRYDLAVHGHRLTLDRIPGEFRRGRELTDGDELDLGSAPDGSEGWKLRAYHTPGHDRGHLIFVEDRYRAAIVGDLISTLSTIVIDPPEGHMATYLASLRRARGLDLDILYPAHGPAAIRPERVLGRVLEHRAAREAKLADALSSEPTAAGELVSAVYDDVPSAMHAIAERSLLAGLEKLAEEGRAVSTDAGWARA